MENQRIRISKTMLKTGLLKLLREKPLSQITVYELCKVSQINRTTFYKYYGSQEDLLNEIETDFLGQLDGELKQVIAQSSNSVPLILQHLYDQRELFCLLVRSVPMQEFAAHLFALPSIGILFQNRVDEGSYSATEAKYIRQFVFQGTFSVLYDWLNSEAPEPVEEIANVLGLLKSKL
ncbi:MAG: TetR/AcrR family transcriptional regulator [Clostridiales bacterium]|nr:TetR/AcrR family transcriptional regulator [Clostridiales bacterium]MCC8099257.1 TetR/AcrR family transcriptional regulator [Clostridiales bacterium]